MKNNVKIKINVNLSNLNAVIFILHDYIMHFKPHNFVFKALFYLAEDLLIKLERKAITERKNNQNFNITLKYYEAFALHSVLRHFLEDNQEDYYIINSANLIANQIHLQL